MNIAHLIERTAARFPDKVAFRDAQRELTFAEMDQETNRVAHGLARLGIEKGDRVALVVENSVEFPLTSFGTTKRGAIVVPLLVRSTVAEMTRWLDTADAKVVFASAQAVEHVVAASAGLARTPHIVVVGGDGAGDGALTYAQLVTDVPAERFDIDLTGEDLLTIRFTGGTTGTPKGVTSSHRNYVSLYSNQLLNLPFDETDVALHIHPLSHAAGHLMFGYLAAGATQVIHPAFNLQSEAVLTAIETHRVTSVFIIPTVLDGLVSSPQLSSTNTSSLRTIIYGGAPMALERLLAGRAAFGNVFLQIYGNSEAPQLATTLTLEDHVFEGDEPPARLRSAGREILNVELRVVDDDGVAVEAGTVGEVAIRGDHTMVGYWRNDALTSSRVKNGWVHTGDMAYRDEEGYLYIVDRKDDMIITGGFNVWPNELEGIIYEHPDVEEAVVFGVSDAKWGEAVTAAVVARPGRDLDEAAVIGFLQERVSKYKVPKRVYMRETALPKSAVGKLLRRRAREECLAGDGEPTS